jgi:hypothetical protein
MPFNGITKQIITDLIFMTDTKTKPTTKYTEWTKATFDALNQFRDCFEEKGEKR